MMRSGQGSHILGVGQIWIKTVEAVVVDTLADADAIPH